MILYLVLLYEVLRKTFEDCLSQRVFLDLREVEEAIEKYRA